MHNSLNSRQLEVQSFGQVSEVSPNSDSQMPLPQQLSGVCVHMAAHVPLQVSVVQSFPSSQFVVSQAGLTHSPLQQTSPSLGQSVSIVHSGGGS